MILLQAWLPDTTLQLIAFENGLSETAFLVRKSPERLELRWFTPNVEVDLCGHATLASAFVLFTQLGQAGARVIFDTKSGPLPVLRQGDRYEMDFPARPAQPVVNDAELSQGLGLTPRHTSRSRDYLCVFDSESEVRQLRPDFRALAELDVVGIIATAPGEDCDFVSRFFAPRVGVNEDPVTGSAHCTLVPYWAERLGKKTLFARQISRRGGHLFCELCGDRVKISGSCALYLRGEIDIGDVI